MTRCILELLNVRKPLKNSYLTQDQIDLLYEVRMKYNEENNLNTSNTKQIDDIHKVNLSSNEKYLELKLGKTPEEWIMGIDTPNDFIKYVKKIPQLHENLMMVFHPILVHTRNLEPYDMIGIMIRFRQWCNLNIITISRTFFEQFSESKLYTMQELLKDKWYTKRFHVAILHHSHWVALLIDTHSKTFEVYDPFRNNMSTSAYTAPLLKAALKVDAKLHPVVNTPNIKEHELVDSALPVLMYIHGRVVQNCTYKTMVNRLFCPELSDSVKKLFFTIPDPVDLFKYSDYRMKYGEFDCRVAMAVYYRIYLAYLISLIGGPTALHLQKVAKSVYTLSRSKQKYGDIIFQMHILQKSVLCMINADTNPKTVNPWSNIVHSVHSDTLSSYLRNEKDNKKRYSTTLYFYRSIMNCPEVLNKKLDIQRFIRLLLDDVYVPVLQFDNSKLFNLDMNPRSFLKQTMKRKETVSFGVRFLRDIDDWCVHKWGCNQCLSGEFASRMILLRPPMMENFKELQQTVTKCEVTIAKVKQIVRESLVNRHLETT